MLPWIIQKSIWAWVILIASFHMGEIFSKTVRHSKHANDLRNSLTLGRSHSNPCSSWFSPIFHHMATSVSSALGANAIKIGLLAAFVCEMHCLLNFARNGQLISIAAIYSSPHSLSHGPHRVVCLRARSLIVHIWPNEMTKQGYLDLHMYIEPSIEYGYAVNE